MVQLKCFIKKYVFHLQNEPCEEIVFKSEISKKVFPVHMRIEITCTEDGPLSLTFFSNQFVATCIGHKGHTVPS